MKKILFLVCVLVCTRVAKAQTFDEWFRQKKTQIQYLVDQIAAYQVYAGFLEKGYRLAEDGLTTIHEIKNGEINLHKIFYTGLKSVNPAISGSGVVADCLNSLSMILQCTKNLKNSRTFTKEEKAYLRNVAEGLEKTCAVSLEQLTGLLTNDLLVLNDAERMQELEKIQASLKEACAFVQDFTSGAGLLNSQRKGNLETINRSKRIFGLRN